MHLFRISLCYYFIFILFFSILFLSKDLKAIDSNEVDVTAKVINIYRSNSKKLKIDKRLKDLSSQLKQLPFTRYKLVLKQNFLISKGKNHPLALHDGRHLIFKNLGNDDNNQIRLDLSIAKILKTVLRLKSGATFMIVLEQSINKKPGILLAVLAKNVK